MVIKNALKQFVANPTVIISNMEEIEATPALRRKMDEIGELLAEKLKDKK